MSCTHCPAVERLTPRETPRASPWLPVAVVVAVLGAALLASAMAPDTRDLAARKPFHARSQAL